METELKICSVCKVEKPYSEFHKQNNTKDGYYFCCKDCRKSYSKRDYEKRKEEVKKKSLEYYFKNKDKRRIYVKKYQKERLKNDPLFKTIRNLRNRLYYALRNKGWKKNCSFDKYIGLNNYKELIEYLESKFTLEMNWDNYGTYWEIDHIIPLSPSNTEEELYTLCHYTNLQPMKCSDNRRKYNHK